MKKTLIISLIIIALIIIASCDTGFNEELVGTWVWSSGTTSQTLVINSDLSGSKVYVQSNTLYDDYDGMYNTANNDLSFTVNQINADHDGIMTVGGIIHLGTFDIAGDVMVITNSSNQQMTYYRQ